MLDHLVSNERKHDLCVLILQYNSADLTLDLLESLVTHESANLPRYRVIVMDNHSADPREEDITSRYPFVRFVRFPENYGFARAHNLIMESVYEEWLLLLNNDCILLNDAVSRTLKKSIASHVDFATCALLNEDGSNQMNFSTAPAPMRRVVLHCSGINRIILEKIRLRLRSCRVGYIDGAFLMIRHSSIPPPALFDSRYFMYTEDLDLMIRMHRSGRKGKRFSEGRVIHLGGASAQRAWGDGEQSRRKLRQAEECMSRYYPPWQVSIWRFFNRFR
jgi:GT2 family glycosyltransferase